MITRKFLFVLACAVVTNAHAEWTRVGAVDKNPLFIDHSKIKRDGDIAKLWILVEYPAPQVSKVGAGKAASSIQQYEVRCKSEMVGLTYISDFSAPKGGGKLIGSRTFSGESDFSPAAPGSVSDHFVSIACK